ncbi:hypothetical protein SAMN02910275_02931 [Butyrivibrio sp. INlla18]|uniref:hypothetical protein n=1 Tax=Butyrivibrio sp. INlla18 TaxID=1520806 RepID=UPI00087F3D54|nr:hypothetical protein [Butyrivibrio sp. INlla18]SDA79086.1 hypothetical protein SAMN02910275_02931 [Butyrivibrio sp. INlla18]
MRAKYKSILVKFREDDPSQLAAWEYMRERLTEKRSYAAIIAEMVAETPGDSTTVSGQPLKQIEESLSRLEHICLSIDEKVQMGSLPPTGANAGSITTGTGAEEIQSEGRYTAGIANLVLSMGDEDGD